MAFVETGVEESLYIELPMDYHDLQDQMSLKQEIVSDFVRASLALSKMFHGEIAAKSRSVRVPLKVCRKITVIVLMCVDNLFTTSATNRDVSMR